MDVSHGRSVRSGVNKCTDVKNQSILQASSVIDCGGWLLLRNLTSERRVVHNRTPDSVHLGGNPPNIERFRARPPRRGQRGAPVRIARQQPDRRTARRPRPPPAARRGANRSGRRRSPSPPAQPSQTVPPPGSAPPRSRRAPSPRGSRDVRDNRGAARQPPPPARGF